uniref:Uncharacterized protein n=1 Tax=Periophthalmus magnuspinnatus TaxID=409849 RepID=A0A3B4BD84_9GOBI
MSSSSKPLCHFGWQTPTSNDGNSASLKTEKRLQHTKAKMLTDSPKSTSMCSPPLSPSKKLQQKKQTGVEERADFGYLEPTVSSRARALSPYTHRRMCQLSEEARQRLSHLQLGPHLFKKTSSNPPPFSVCTSVLGLSKVWNIRYQLILKLGLKLDFTSCFYIFSSDFWPLSQVHHTVRRFTDGFRGSFRLTKHRQVASELLCCF